MAYALHEQASQETLVSLLQLDPAPIESPYAEDEKDLQFSPEDDAEHTKPTTAGSPTPLGLSRSNSHASHNSIYYLTRIQKYSSYLIPVFTTIHLANTSLIPLITRSVPASETYLLQARELYQTTLTEPLLVTLPIAAHIASGLALRLIRRSQNLARYGGSTPGMYALARSRTNSPSRHGDGNSSSSNTRSHRHDASNARGKPQALRIWPPLSWIATSGYVLAGLVAAHACVNRLLPLYVEGDSANIGLAYVAHGFARHPFVSWTAYVALVAATAGHTVWGAARWAGIAPVAMGWRGAGPRVEDKSVRRRRRRAWWGVQGAVVAVAALWAAGGLGVVARGGPTHGWVGKVYDSIYDVLPW
ncbi:uncharacterized protein VDAG_01648 [Verticillium dahliae VdLs.17]|uniref:Mitochondrial adapter protein MCP1 transmembrane domain-containing protein n=2 Tax=Verticillium dahliae TaxID=27337 RepID=G2WVL2_VERDV|nr:uncharacterized protein VDAG_01648 [Verticillium dahliae VdLs.17]EGY19632.1 hypothetical protein VDAG_01648 [Verticillium dahliae VdLs.17]KAH6705923.1 hypothetical protein EV126DRAFT_379631 [Verticillium dahliae]PNH33096.1 hypothetical protein BJF96_g3648 [Verticillium dahliae]PNH52553.1 hypothetical protein VD0003_g4769 [Verticillium dahliae]